MEKPEDISKELRAELQKKMLINITDEDLKNYFPNTKNFVMKYSDLENIKHLNEILPYDKSFKIILIEQNFNLGHWVLILRYGNVYEFFDSYGLKIDQELKFIHRIQNILLGQNKKYMTELFKKIPKGFKKIVNRKRLQQVKNKSATCGRWVISRIQLMRMGYNLEEYQDFVKKWASKLELSLDEIVTLWIS